MARRSIKQSKRRQQLHRRMLLTGIAAFMIVLIVGVSSYRARNSQDDAALQTAETEVQDQQAQKTASADSQMKQDQTEGETEEERLKRVKKEALKNDYPDDVIELLSKNPATVDFVENYEEKKDEPCAESIGSDYVEGEIPKLIQWDERWGYKEYGTSLVAASGCGPTCVSMVLIGLKEDPTITPAVVADFSAMKGCIDDENSTYWSLMTEAADNWGLDCAEGTFSEGEVKAELKKGHPIICSVSPGDFTKIGHFIVLTDYSDGEVTVHDPFNEENSAKKWIYKDIEDQIVEMWIYSVK